MMRADCQRCREMLDDFLSSELLVETSQDVLRHVNGCLDCRAELERRQALREQLKRVLEISPVPAVESAILNALHAASSGRQQRARPSRWTSGWRQLTGVMGVCVTAMSAVWIATVYEPLSAAELLSKSADAERAVLSARETALHRVLNVDERILPAGTLVSRHRVDQWRDSRTGVTVRRTYNESDQLVAGEWVDSDRLETVFARGAAPKSRSPDPTGVRAVAVLQSGQAWRMGLSVEEFAALIPEGAESRVRSVANGYELSYASPSTSNHHGIRRASLILSRPDLRPVHQRLEIRRAERSYEYLWVEQQFGTVPSRQLKAEVFNVERDLARLQPAAEPSATVAAAPALPAPAAGPPAATRKVSSSALIDVLYRLHRIDACLWGDVNVRFAADGRVEVLVRVPDEARQTHALAALRDMAPAINSTIDISATDTGAIETVGPVGQGLTDLPAYQTVRRYFQTDLATRVPPGQVSAEALNAAIDGAIGRMADRVVQRAGRATDHATALRAMVGTFPTSRPDGASLTAVATWQTMLRDHMRGFVRETEALRLELQPIFFPALDLNVRPEPDGPEGRALPDVVDEVLARARSHERAVRASFSADVSRASVPAVAAAEFWQSLVLSERLGPEFERPWVLDDRRP